MVVTSPRRITDRLSIRFGASAVVPISVNPIVLLAMVAGGTLVALDRIVDASILDSRIPRPRFHPLRISAPARLSHNVLYGLLHHPAGRLAFCTTVY